MYPADLPPKNPNPVRMRHWVLFIGLAVACAQFYFLTVLVDFYAAPRMVVFAAATS